MKLKVAVCGRAQVILLTVSQISSICSAAAQDVLSSRLGSTRDASKLHTGSARRAMASVRNTAIAIADLVGWRSSPPPLTTVGQIPLADQASARR
ncbi:hypothetical protein [Streptomyces sp. NPDC003710]